MIIVPHFSSGIVEQAKRERAWKSPHARKGDTPAACCLFLRRLIFTSASSQAIFTPPFPLPPLQPRPQGFSLKKWVGTRLPPLYVWVKLLGYILTSRIKLIFGVHGLQEMFFWIEKKFGRQAEFYNQSHRVQRSFVLINELLIKVSPWKMSIPVAKHD